MEFWGIEVKPGQTVKCEPGNKKVLHLSQASLGVNKKEKSSETLQVFVKVNDQKLVIGTLSTEKYTQIQYDLVFEKDFELSHGSKSTSVFFVGYRGIIEGYESDHDLNDSSSEDDIDIDIDEKLNGKPSKKVQGKPTAEKAGTQKVGNETTKLNAKPEKPKKEQAKADNKMDDEDADDSDDDEDDSEDSDEDMIGAQEDSSEEDEDSTEDEASPEKLDTGKKRKQDSTSETPLHDKKAKIVTPAQNQKTGGNGKKGGHVHIATPYPSKQGGKSQQTPKSGGSVVCKSCNRNFNSENALQAHSKAKHGAAEVK